MVFKQHETADAQPMLYIKYRRYNGGFLQLTYNKEARDIYRLDVY
jgi:hypothetical protein